MAKIIATFDTVDKSLTVDMDGKKFKSVSDVSFFKSFDGDNFFAEVRTVSEGSDDGVITVTRTMASDGTIETTETEGNFENFKKDKDKDKDKKKDKKKDKDKEKGSDAEALGKLLFHRTH